MKKSLELDIKSQDGSVKLNWIELLAYLGTKYGGNFKKYKAKDLDEVSEKILSGETIENLILNEKLFDYYMEAYTAVLGEFVGEHQVKVKDPTNPEQNIAKNVYGLKVFSPIARGYGFSHYDDFGDSRTFGFKRRHLGNDLMGGIGTPIVAVESGYVEVMGWNYYGGWRVGIRSFDKKRYYYYAHLRKGKPFHQDLFEGKIVRAGDVIGYLGMTGYSRKEDTNNIKVPHLHFGLQLIFDESQKDGVNQIWIDVYDIVELLRRRGAY